MARSRGGRLTSRGCPGRAGRSGSGGGRVSVAAAVDGRNKKAAAVASPSAKRAPEWAGKPQDLFLAGIDGWTKRIFRRENGGKLDSYWYSPGGHKFRSTTEVKNFLEILGKNNGDEEAAYQKFKGRQGCQSHAPCSNRGRAGRLSARSGRGQQRGGVDQENDKQRRRRQQQQQKARTNNIATNGDDQGPLQPPSPWRNSKAKMKLTELLKDESSWVQVCDPYHVFCADEDFRKYDENNFINNFKSLKNKIETDRCAVEFDKLCFEHDRILHPASSTNKRGDKRYEGSGAERQLKEDVNAGQSKGHAPKEMWLSNPIYNEYLTLKQFRSHKLQEERSLKEKVYWQKKRNEKGKMDHDKQVAKMDD